MLSGLLSRSSEALQWVDGRHSSWSLKVNDFHLRESDPESTTTKPAATFFVGICGYWENSLADSRLDFTEKSPQRTEVALEFVQSSISAIWSQPSDSDYEHTPNGCFSFMGLRFRAALCFTHRIKQPCVQYFSSESEKWHEWEKILSISNTRVKLSLHVIHTELIYYEAL